MRQYGRAAVAVGLAAIGPTGALWADTGSPFWRQKHDFVDALSSEQGTSVDRSRTADDFAFDLAYLDAITVFMIVSFPNQPLTYAVDLYEDENSRPGALIDTFVDPTVIDRGEWNGMVDQHLFEITFVMTSYVLHSPDFYWISPYGIGNGSGTDSARWGTANFGDPVLSEGMFLSEELGFPDWTGVSHTDLLGERSDFAFELFGHLPTPGGLAVVGVGLLARSRRRHA